MTDRRVLDRTTSRVSDDQGAVIVEAAIVLPLLIVMFLGVFDFGIGWRQTRILSSALGNAARQVASTQDGRNADLFALQSFMATMNDTQSTTVTKVVIYKSTATGAPTDANCLTRALSNTSNGISGACNIYSNFQLQPGQLTTTNFGNPTDTSCVSTQFDRWWCPKNRNVIQSAPPDFVGIYAQATFVPVSGLWGTTFTFTDRVVTQIEPKVV